MSCDTAPLSFNQVNTQEHILHMTSLRAWWQQIITYDLRSCFVSCTKSPWELRYTPLEFSYYTFSVCKGWLWGVPGSAWIKRCYKTRELSKWHPSTIPILILKHYQLSQASVILAHMWHIRRPTNKVSNFILSRNMCSSIAVSESCIHTIHTVQNNGTINNWR